MNPRPIHRWKSFWLGLCVLVFLGWGWRDGYRRISGCFLKFEDRELQFTRAMGMTLVYYRQGATYLTPLPPGRFQYHPYRLRTYFSGDWAAYDDYGSPQAKVPDSLVFCPALALWLAWLLCHWKREQKKHTP